MFFGCIPLSCLWIKALTHKLIRAISRTARKSKNCGIWLCVACRHNVKIMKDLYFTVCRLFLIVGFLVSVCGSDLAEASTNQPPQVSIVSPTNGATFAASANILVSANVTIGDQWTRFVSLYDGTNRLAYLLLDPLVVSNGYVLPLTIPWDNVPAGNHTLTLAVTDTPFTSPTSAPVSLSLTG